MQQSHASCADHNRRAVQLHPGTLNSAQDAGPRFNEHSSQTTLHSLGDLNGDQVTDMVTLTLSGRSLIRQRSIYEVHFGISTAAGIAFEGSAGAVLAPRSKGGGIQPWGYSSRLFRDFDDDGDVDVMFRDIRIGIGGMSRALLGNSVSMDLEFYRLDAGVYPDKPTTILRIRPALKPFSGRDVMFFPTALTGDVDGDGRVDLLVAKSRQELQVFFGVPGPGMFAPQPHTLAIDLPADMDRSIRLLDFNNDARQDILLHHPSTTQPNRLTMLVARQLPNRFEQKGRPYAGDCAAHSRIAQAVLP